MFAVSMSAPLSRSSYATLTCPRSEAVFNGVDPYELVRLVSAPPSIRSLTTSRWPFWEETCSAVSRLLAAAPTSALFSSNSSPTLAWPFKVAVYNDSSLPSSLLLFSVSSLSSLALSSSVCCESVGVLGSMQPC